MLKQHSQFMITLLVVADALAISVAWLLSYWLRFNWLEVDPAKGVPPLTVAFLPSLPLVVAAHLLIFYRVRLYRPRRDTTILSETRDIVKAFFVAVVAVILIDYAMPQSNKISRKFIATYAVVGATCFALFRGSVRVFLRRARRRGWNRRTAAIVGAGRTAQRLQQALAHNAWTGMDVAYFVDDTSGAGTRRIRGAPLLGPLSALNDILEQHPVDSVFVALPAARASQLDEVLAALQTSMADVRVVPAIAPSYTLRPEVSELDGVPILSLRQTPLIGWNAVSKRMFDLCVGTACLLIAAVPMLVIALLIKLTSRGPVFYTQERMGLDGERFRMIKFRTMHVDAEAGGAVWSRREDPRRTRIGAFLRRTSLDELPNLFNVIKGEMSIVGPRPPLPREVAHYDAEHMQRLAAVPGITGLWQVRGRSEIPFEEMVAIDLEYIERWSLWLDAKILLQTPFAVIGGKGAW